MDLNTQFRIKNNPYLSRYLREHSYWYKQLQRNPSSLSMMEEEMRYVYRLTTGDRIEDFGKKIELIQNFMDLLG